MKKQTQPNFIILMTDQQRTLQHFPMDWVKRNLPNYQFFLDQGANFKNHICNTTPCGPSRASLFTGMYPAKNGITGNLGSVAPQQMNFARVLADVGYDVYYKGKLHMYDDFTRFSYTWANDPETAPAMARGEDNMIKQLYGMDGWLSPDFGTALVGENPTKAEIATMAGGAGHNDQRVVSGTYKMYAEQESVLEFLHRVQNEPPERPFCLVVSLLNPHDVSLYPWGWEAAGYQNSLFAHFNEFQLPQSYYLDDLSTKPQVQSAYLNGGLGGKLESTDALNYVKFYGYLHTLSDALHRSVLDAISPELRESSYIVRMADHGEMGMAHSGLQEKMFTAYNETMHVPLIWYHPTKVAAGDRDQMVGLIDFVPTIAELAGNDPAKYPDLQGQSYAAALSDPTAASVDAVLFNFPMPSDKGGGGDDNAQPDPCSAPTNTPTYTYSVNVPPTANPSDYPANIYAILTSEGWKYAVYYSLDSAGAVDWASAQYELYNENEDPDEINNLLPFGQMPSPDMLKKQEKLHAQLTQLLQEKGIQPEGWAKR